MGKIFVKSVDLRRTAYQLKGVRENEEILYSLGDIWLQKFNEYAPGGPEGELAQSAEVYVKGNHAIISYSAPYAHYVWEGEMYIDDYGYSGYPRGDGTWFGTPAERLETGHKHPSGTQLNFDQGVSHWTVVAQANEGPSVRQAITQEIGEYFYDLRHRR